MSKYLWGQPVPSRPGRNVLERLRRPFLAGYRGNPRRLSCIDEEGTEERKKDNRAKGHLYPLTIPTPKKGGNPRLRQSLVKQENVRPRWVLLYPTAQWPRVRTWLSAQKSMLVHRCQDLLLGCRREGGGGGRQQILTCSRLESAPYARGPGRAAKSASRCAALPFLKEEKHSSVCPWEIGPGR